MTSTQHDLQQQLHRIDGKGYPAYKDIRGKYAFTGFTLFIDHVQGDPFAAPSRLRVRLPMAVAQLVDEGQLRAIGQALNRRQLGDYVTFRPYEQAAAINRLRTLRVKTYAE